MSALKAVIRMVRAGQTTIVFPEGSRTLDGNLQPAQPGLGLIIAKTMAPVVPMRIFGAFEAFPRGGKRIRALPVRVKIGPPVFFSAQTLGEIGGEGRDLYQRLSEHVMSAIAAIRWEEEK